MKGPDGKPAKNNIFTLIKVDVQTLEPVALLDVGARLHHGHVVQDKYILMEAFAGITNKSGLHVFLYDPATDSVIGGVSTEDLGGNATHAYPGPEGKYAYLLMTPSEYGRPSSPLKTTSAYQAMHAMRSGEVRWIPQSFWVAKVDLATWEVVREYPYPALRADWIQFSGDHKSMYLNGSGDDRVVKVDLESGDMIRSSPTGPGPYGVEVNANDTEVWVVDKGESSHPFGRTVTVVDAKKGKTLATLPSAYQVNRFILSPDGKEMWLSSNGEGQLWVFDAKNRELINRIDMPGLGRAHGMSFVYYDEKGGRVVADQGDFHNGIDPRNGKPLVLKQETTSN